MSTSFGPWEIDDRFDVAGGGFDALARDASGKELRLWVGAEGSGRPDDLEEARKVLGRIYQASLPRVTGCDVVDGRAVLLVQPYRGQTLADRLAAGPLGTLEALDLAKGIGAGLVKAHAAGVVHGSVREDEILLTDDGRALLLHLGLGPFLGARPARAPEDLETAERVESSDVLGLSRILHRALFGRDPYGKDDESLRTTRPDGPDALPPELPEGLRRLLARAVARDPAERIHRAEELAGDLRVIRASWDSLSAPPPRPLVPFPPIFHRGGLLVALVTVVLAAVLTARSCSG